MRGILGAPTKTTEEVEAKKDNHEMAEYDQTFIDRVLEMADIDIIAYLQLLPEAQRKVMEEAIFREMSQRAVKDSLDEINGGFVN